MSKIYNKNAREKALLEEAYTGVYNEAAVDVELESWWEYDPHDVVVKVYHGALHAMPPGEGTPEYEANSEKIFTWLKGKYPQPDDYDINKVEFRSRTADDATEWANRVSRDPKSRFYDPKHDEDAEGAISNLMTGIGRGIGDVAKGVGRVGVAAGGAGAAAAGGALGAAMNIARTLTADQLKALGEYALEKAAGGEEDAEMEFDERGFAKNTKAGKEGESREERADVDKYEYEQGKEAGEREDHDKGVKMAHEALEMFKDELHVGGHGEDINVNELADAHDQLSRALHWLLDETDVEYITGGRATQKAEAEVNFKPAYGEY